MIPRQGPSNGAIAALAFAAFIGFLVAAAGVMAVALTL